MGTKGLPVVVSNQW